MVRSCRTSLVKRSCIGTPPFRRYGVGVLFAAGTSIPEEVEPAEAPIVGAKSEDQSDAVELTTHEFRSRIESGMNRVSSAIGVEGETSEANLTGANGFEPSVMALTFLIDDRSKAELRVLISGGWYEPRSIEMKNGTQTCWLRHGIKVQSSTSIAELQLGRNALTTDLDPRESGGLDLEVFCVSRADHDGHRLITVGVANRTACGDTNRTSLFQTHITVDANNEDGSGAILPYPEAHLFPRDDEEQSIDLLFRDFPTFSVGHGCAADWEYRRNQSRIGQIRGESMPSHETPSITSDIPLADGGRLYVAMAPLAGLVEGHDGSPSLHEVVDGYEEWISLRESELQELAAPYHAAGKRHLLECREMLRRMREGLLFLERDDDAAKAFRWANEAILNQQIRAGGRLRTLSYDAGQKSISLSEPMRRVDPLQPPEGRGKWRPFQIAFLLAAIESTANQTHPDRELVDLIFFPTGGGKTEAYLGLSAFSIFYRRLKDPNDCGTQILMRYTLRLLTAQQFQRASSLICAMEMVRGREEAVLGVQPFRIGIWVGGGTTPNRRSDAQQNYKDLSKGDENADNKFILISVSLVFSSDWPCQVRGEEAKVRSRGCWL